ncbi:coniferyl aldehyde dehydrogenase [uncultured Roseovarius sp.]|uniref:coniferyl aldehyde dehydrogenase n=1 Tax=uncultured Roseovarius sp. TaxID=293344 RepID=UPI00263964E4|nr:coniferyl aldehyde dehydrogenase [uncultured Roseovarius sp.]
MTELRSLFENHRAAYLENPYPDLATRMERLHRLSTALAKKREGLIAAINKDFGCRSRSETVIAEILGSHGAIHYAEKNLHRWMKLKRRLTSMWFAPAKNYMVPQPLGVVGIMAPWNYPMHLSIAPLVAALAAGNNVMLWISEETPNTTRCLAQLIEENFDPSLITVVAGDPKIAPEYSALPFDHLLFTGSTRVGKLVATAAAKNLTPVTLELGGKSPAVIAPDYSCKEAAKRIAWGKSFNAGQTCIAPDYVLLPEKDKRAFAEYAIKSFKSFYNSILDYNYTAVISERFFRRLRDMVKEAEDKGATVLQPYGITESVVAGVHKFPLTLILDAPEDCAVMQEEIFGPILPVVGYKTLDDAISYINARERPLSLYCFSGKEATRREVLRKTCSGSVGLNDVLLQYLQEDLAFGGVGSSGTGAYHGREGFETFSHMKSVFAQKGIGHFTGAKLLYPPYGPVAKTVLKLMGA